MSFWERATAEQKLAQIDGGIECRMTSKQIAMCLGAPSGKNVNNFAQYHDRHFRGGSVGKSEANKSSRFLGMRRNAELRNYDLPNSESARIFPKEQEESFLNIRSEDD